MILNRSVDIKWLRSLSDEEFEKWVNDLRDSCIYSNSFFIDLRDSILGVLVKRDICPLHWFKDECPIEVYGRSIRLGSKYESDLKRQLDINDRLRSRIKKLESLHKGNLIERAKKVVSEAEECRC